MKNITLESTIQIWSFTIGNIWFEVHFDTSNQIIKEIFKENNKEVTEEERELIYIWASTLKN